MAGGLVGCYLLREFSIVRFLILRSLRRSSQLPARSSSGERNVLGASETAGPVLFDAFLADLPRGAKAAFEFRHASWFDDAIFERLRDRNLALCFADSAERSTPLVPTASYGYFRLRDEGYTDDDIDRWAETIRAHQDRWEETFVYFKHEEEGKGPDFAKRLMRRLDLPVVE